MVKWSSFKRWARSRGYVITKEGQKEETITGVNYADGRKGTPINTGHHNNPDGVPDRLLQEIASRLAMNKHDLEKEIG